MVLAQCRKRATVKKFAAGIDRLTVAEVDMILELLFGSQIRTKDFCEVWCLRALGRSIEVSPTADHIVAFQCESRWIEACVTTRACRVFAVSGELLANRGRSFDVRFYGGHVRRRGLRRLAEDLLHHPYAAFDGTGRRAVGGHFADGGHRQKTASGIPGLIDIDVAKASPFHAGDAVMLGQTLAHDVDRRRQQTRHWQSIVDRKLEKLAGLATHRIFEIRLEFGIELLVGACQIEVAQIEPLIGEVLVKPIGLGIAEQPVRCGSQALRIVQRAGLRGGEQRIVRTRIPQQVRQPSRERITIKHPGRLIEE